MAEGGQVDETGESGRARTSEVERQVIEVKNLWKAYGEVQALRGISFSVAPGEICGYLGPNGAGKTTTIKVLTGISRPGEGEVRVGGFDVTKQPLEVKKRIGYVPETGAVYSALSANEYLALVGALHGMGPAEIAERSRRLLGVFGISDAADRRLDTLSKGMRQKVVITAALLHDPEVVLMDEPLSGLDANAARMIKTIVRGLAQAGKTILYCSHMLDIVERLCPRVVILHRGQIAAAGPTQELIRNGRKGSLETLFQELTGAPQDEELIRAMTDGEPRP